MSTPCAYYHRPYQGSRGVGSVGKTSKSSEKDGRALLDLLRSRDKLIGRGSNNDASEPIDDEEELLLVENELISSLDSLNASIRRCGLFANSERAQAFYTHASERSSSTAGSNNINDNDNAADGSSKKRKRKKGGAGGGTGGSNAGSLSATSYGIYLDSHSNDTSTTTFSGMSSGGEKQDLDEGLVLTAICKILGVTIGRRKKMSATNNGNGDSNTRTTSVSSYSYGLKCAALNVISSLCDHAKDNAMSISAASIEGDMIGSIGSPLLDALVDNILYLYYRSCEDQMLLLEEGLAGCFKACASVISLLETKISRADKTMQSLQDVAWQVLNKLPGLSSSSAEQDGEVLANVQKAATAMLSVCVLTGNNSEDSMCPPSKLWSQSVSEGITLLRWAIHDFYPVPSFDGPSGNGKGDGSLDAKVKKYHDGWLAIAKEVPTAANDELDLGSDQTDNHRTLALRSRIQCITSYINSLLTMEHYPLHRLNGISSSTLQLPLDSLLDISEVFLSFPLAAEANYRSTKPRLRSSPIKDGLISPNGAMEIAPDVRLCGHALLDATVESSRCSSGVWSRARRVVGMSVANLQSSCSTPLLSVVVDKGRRGNSSGGGSIGSWLRGSIPLRINSIGTFHSAAISLGSGVMMSNGTAKMICRALVLVGGCLLEQVNNTGDNTQDVNDEWGTLGERARLVEISSTTLASCIAAFGGLIPNNVRSTLDSITQSCLSALYSRGGGASVFAYSHVKRSMLQLGLNCICVPWGDGGRCSNDIANIVRTVSTMLRSDPDLSVASAALSTLATFDAFMTPRAPPILIPTRGSPDNTKTSSYDTGLTASVMLQGMDESKMDMTSSREAEKDKKQKSISKSDKRSKKKAKKEKKNEAEAKAPPEGNIDTTKATESSYENIGGNGKGGSLLGKSDSKVNDTANDSKSSAANNTDTVTASNGDLDILAGTPSAEPAVEMQNNQKDVEPQDNNDDISEDKMDTSPNKAEDDINMKETTQSGSDDEDSDDGSLDDFPDIVDEDPDEEDIV